MSLAENRKKPRGKPFAAGNAANPGGRPKRTEEEFELISACKTKTPAALEVIERIMVDGESEKTRLAAAIAIIERAYGKPTQDQNVNMTGMINHSGTFVINFKGKGATR
jgi:hypothetical protein